MYHSHMDEDSLYDNRVANDNGGEGRRDGYIKTNHKKNKVISRHFYDVKRKQTQCKSVNQSVRI